MGGYIYTKNNQLLSPHSYNYTEYLGENFLNYYLHSRLSFLAKSSRKAKKSLENEKFSFGKVTSNWLQTLTIEEFEIDFRPDAFDKIKRDTENYPRENTLSLLFWLNPMK